MKSAPNKSLDFQEALSNAMFGIKSKSHIMLFNHSDLSIHSANMKVLALTKLMHSSRCDEVYCMSSYNDTVRFSIRMMYTSYTDDV